MKPIHTRLRITAFVSISIFLLLVACSTSIRQRVIDRPDDQLIERVKNILKETPLIDGHNDLPTAIHRAFRDHLENLHLESDSSVIDHVTHTDIPSMRQGRVGGQFWSVYVSPELEGGSAVFHAVEMIDSVQRLKEHYPDTFDLALYAEDIRRIHAEGKIACLIGIEGGHMINNSLAVLRQFYRMGARYMTLTHWKHTDWCDAATQDPVHGGLTPFGKVVVKEMNRLGMMVDLSHTSPETMHDVLDISTAPVIFSHSSTRSLVNHPRNVPDDVLERIRENGGIVMVTFVSGFISEEVRSWWAASDAEQKKLSTAYPADPEIREKEFNLWKKKNPRPSTTYLDVADHIDHIRKVAGIDHIGIGADYEGLGHPPEGLEKVSGYPVLLAELMRRGYTEEDVRKVAGLNLLRVMEAVETIAGDLQTRTRASEADLEDLDRVDETAETHRED